MSGSPVVAILGTRYEDFSIEEEVLAPSGARICSGPAGDLAQIVASAATADVILAGSAPRFDESVLQSLTCRGIVRYGVGTESIDLAAARRRGIWVARVADYGTEAVATHAVAMAMSCFRRLHEADARVRAGNWGFASLRPLHLPSASTVGIVGFGRIGQFAARQFLGLGFSVVAYDPMVDVEGLVESVSSVQLAELLSRSDIVSLHLPGSPDGTPVFDDVLIAQLKPGSVLVNTSRGSLIDLPALRAGLAKGQPLLAALDVFPREPADAGTFEGVEESVLLSPHMAWYTEESEKDLRRKAASEALRMLRGERPLEVVVDPTEPGERK